MKIALVVGASGTLGSEITSELLNNNYIVYGIHNNLIPNINNRNFFSYKYDLNNEKNYEELIKKLSSYGNVASFIFIYASGINSKCNIEEFDSHEFIKYLNINSLGFMNLYKNIFSFIKKCDITNIVLIGTNLLNRKNKGSIYYNLSKSLQEQIVKQVAYEHGIYNVLINQISPGIFISNMNSNIDEEKLNSIKNNIPLKRISTSKEIANFICKFCINNTYITGETILMDGGNTIGY